MYFRGGKTLKVGTRVIMTQSTVSDEEGKSEPGPHRELRNKAFGVNEEIKIVCRPHIFFSMSPRESSKALFSYIKCVQCAGLVWDSY